MLTNQYQKLVVQEPPETINIDTFIQYKDFVEVDRETTPVADVAEIWRVLEEQCEASLEKIKELRSEIPKVIHFFTMPHPDEEQFTLFGWQAWTAKP